MLGMMVVTWFLSMWISNTASTAMMIPIITAVSKAVREARAGCSGLNKEDLKETDNLAFEIEAVSNKIDIESGKMEPMKNGAGKAGHNHITTNVPR